jgi:hypothetical protein
MSLCAAAAEATTDILGADRAGEDRWWVTLSAKNPVWACGKWSPWPSLTRNFRGATVEDRARRAVDPRVQVDARKVHVAVNLVTTPVGKLAVAERAGA